MWQHTIDAKLMIDDVARAYRAAGFKSVNTVAYTYSFPRLAPAVLNAQANNTIQLDQDAVFVWIGTMASKRQGGFHTSVAGLSLKITDLEGTYSLAGPDPMPSEAFTGSAESPYIFAFPYVNPPGARFRVDVVHLSGSGFSANPDTTPVLFDLSLFGCKLFTVPYTRDVILPEC